MKHQALFSVLIKKAQFENENVVCCNFSGALGAIMNWVLDVLPYVNGSTNRLMSAVIPRGMMDLLTQRAIKAEWNFPLFSIGSVHFRLKDC